MVEYDYWNNENDDANILITSQGFLNHILNYPANLAD